jgi:hypothetical protein
MGRHCRIPHPQAQEGIMKKILALATFTLICAGCTPQAEIGDDSPRSPSQYRMGRSIVMDAYRDHEITHEEATRVLNHLEDKALAWYELYGKKL